MFIWLHLCYAPVGHVTSLCSYFSCFPSLSFLSLYFFLLLKALCIRILLHFLTLPCMKFGKILWFSCFQIKSNIYGCYFSHGIFYHLLSLCFTISSCLHIVLIVNFVEANVWEIIQPNFISLSVDMPIFFSSYFPIHMFVCWSGYFHSAEKAGVVLTLWRTACGRRGHASVHHLLTWKCGLSLSHLILLIKCNLLTD